MSSKSLLALAGAAALLGGCATGPYYDSYGYNDGYYYPDRPVYREYDPPPYPNYVYGPGYYYPYPRAYIAPSIGFSFGYSSGGHRH